MKNLFTYLSISIFAVSLIACSEDTQEPTTTTTTVGEPIEISINASAGAFTRAAYTEGDSDYAFSWSYGDVLRVSYSTSSDSGSGSDSGSSSDSGMAVSAITRSTSAVSTFTTSSTANSSSATFTGTVNSWSGTTDLYTVYDPLSLSNYTFAPSSTITIDYDNNNYYSNDYTSVSSTTNINNMGFLVGVIEDATTTNIPDVTLNQAMSFLQITFEGDLPTSSSYGIGSVQLSTSTGESLFITSATVDIATGEIAEVLSTSSVLSFDSPNINATNNVLTIALLPTTEINAPIILTSSYYGEYEFSATERSGFFERNTVYSGSINISEFSDVVSYYDCDLEDMNSITFDNTIQVQNLTVRCDNFDQLTSGDFEGLRTFLKNQNRKDISLDLDDLVSDIPNNALAGIDTFDALDINFSASSLKIGNSAFKGCSNLNSVSLNDSYYCEIGDSSFEDCVNLQSVGNLDNITSIGDSAFKDCVNFNTTLSLPNTTYIGDYAFYNCNKIGDIELGEDSSDVKLTYLGTGAFSGDSGSYTEDKELYIYDSNAEYLTGDKTLNVSGQPYTFSTIYLNGAVYVHDSASVSDDPAMSVNNANKVSW